MPKIIITGDTHGDFKRFSNRNWPLAKTLTKDDILIITGDFGGVWDDSKEEKFWLDWLENRPFTTLFLDGNHENFDLLPTYPQETWRGGETDVIRPHVRHLQRGCVFDIYGFKVFVMGGAASHDIKDGVLDPNDPDFKTTYKRLWRQNALFRVKGVSWWPEEMPSRAEYERAVRNLKAIDWKPDIVLTHCAPTRIAQCINSSYEPDELTDFLDNISQHINCFSWYFGHYHTDMTIDYKYHCQYEKMHIIET